MPDNKKKPVRRDAYICSAFQLHTAKEGTTPVLNSDDTFFFFASRLFCGLRIPFSAIKEDIIFFTGKSDFRVLFLRCCRIAI